MFDAQLILQGLVLGFSIAAPVGPIGLLCIRRTLAEGRMSGFLSGLGAATADALYGAVAAFGLTLISDLLVAQQFWLRLGGGLFLAYLGIRTLLSVPVQEAATAGNSGTAKTWLSAYLSTFLLTITNPMTIIAFTGMFLGMTSTRLDSGFDSGAASGLVMGVFAGSALWWLTLSVGVGLLRTRIDHTALLWINRISGAVVILFALRILISLFNIP